MKPSRCRRCGGSRGARTAIGVALLVGRVFGPGLESGPPCIAHAQAQWTQRGFIEARGVVFAERARNPPARSSADLLAREEIEWRPRTWLKLAGSFDGRIDTAGHVDRDGRLDFADRTLKRPALAVRRLDATVSRGGLVIDVGKQFVRWGRADLINPIDRFAPRDFLEVIDNEFLAVSGVRALYERGAHTVEGVWVPRMTPSRMPLLDRRWAVLPQPVQPFMVIDRGSIVPAHDQVGGRYSFAGSRVEYSVAVYDGVNHLPIVDVHLASRPLAVDVRRRYRTLRMIGGDGALPLRWLTLKGEGAYFRSGAAPADEYAQYVVQAERQVGEWSLVGGYAGEVSINRRALEPREGEAAIDFAPDRGLTRAFLGRVAYTIDVNRSAALEGAVRQNGDGSYVRGEFSRASGRHWRATARIAWIRGRPNDFLGQYRRNSHGSLTLRYSF